jgi:hypothetical protein
VKTIGKDTIVLMTLKQGNDINKKFSELNDSILNLKKNHNQYMIDNGQRLQKIYTDYNFELNNHRLARVEADSFRHMYMANKKIYLALEEDHKKEIRRLAVITLFTMFFTALFAAK